MFADITKPPAPLPTSELTTLSKGMVLLPPLSRRGHGPGLIILHRHAEDPLAFYDGAPSPLLKWAEEGYAVVQLDPTSFEGRPAEDVLREAVEALDQCSRCDPKGNVGLVSYEPDLWNKAAPALAQVPQLIAGITYIDASALDNLAAVKIPTLNHVAGQTAPSAASAKQYQYPTAKGYGFATPASEHYHYITESISHTRSLQFLKPLMSGPYFDLETIWEEHTYYEFADRSVEHTMSTMVQEPYVNHVPTLTGGIGRQKLTNFYRQNFIFNNSADTELELISRTLGINTVVDEFIFKFTHDREIDWLIPGVPPTGRKAEVPFTAVVNIRGDRLYHEHISWDQGTVLKQLGLMPEYLPFPYDLPDAKAGSFEYRVPVAGSEGAEKMRDRNSVPSNEMFKFEGRKNEDK
ncbi:uncharacterized protein NECHADRAFT_49897 [Fusarium vanettenii 77-13-4]|uniref:Carboxymethylenebutenolidase n=1 Tax=Fusarium vanettenii (strain ATCC MYA-4622 / CBS 123669 / FGSC 9596 / NRRL 45880 / 77-13-4) TaxID=660122 RepID=C7ZP75_FUSV7|nr:uncharacterized protein NECHADRAFT_49897 [Fusarium vanettenii 77-13-4]EEU34097.1 hypothetical protein NECHADRAFT_49897 [Fusarium vanettenii 77-13-4]